jgi:integrase
MPRRRQPAKGPRLWLQPERTNNNGSIERSVWCVLDDGGIKRSTGFGPEDRGAAEGRLAEYIAEKRTAVQPRNGRADQVLIADVIALYLKDRAAATARPRETAARCRRLLLWWGERRLSDVTGQACRSYVEHRGAQTAARRELEDLRAAIRYHRSEGFCREIVEVTLPEKSEGRDRWMTRSEAARLLWTAWTYRERQKGKETERRPWRHVARFILIALKTGTRAGAICSASFEPREGHGWADLSRGVFFRRPQGERETKKRKPPVRIPLGLLAHMRRWRRAGQVFPVEWNRGPVRDVDKAFRHVAKKAGLPDVTPHVLRHTAATWLMQAGEDKWEVAGFLGMTEETLDRIYAHHHPDFQNDAAAAIEHGHRKSTEKKRRTEAEQSASKVIKLARKANG